jgi:putative addiction module component (TIGR02574 family)
MAHPLFGFGHLTPTERAQLAVDLWDSIALERQDDLPVRPAHRAEIARRQASLVKNPDAGAPWEEVKDRLLARVAARQPKKRQAKRRSRA